MISLKRSTALPIAFVALDSSGNPVTGKVDGDFTKRISKNGGAFGAMTVTITEMENGWYSMTLSAAHTDTLGVLSINLSAAGIVPSRLQYRVHSAITDDQQRILDRIDYQRGQHTVAGQTFYVDGVSGNDANPGTRELPVQTITAALALCTSNAHDEIILLPNSGGGPTTITETTTITVNKNYVQIRGPGRDVLVTRSNNGDIFTIEADGVELSGMRIMTFGGASATCVRVTTADFVRLYRLWVENAHQDGIVVNQSQNCEIRHCFITDPVRDCVRINSGIGTGFFTTVEDCELRNGGAAGVSLQGSDASSSHIMHNMIHDCAVGVDIGAATSDTEIMDNRFGNNTTDIVDGGTATIIEWNRMVEVVDATLGRSLAGGANGGRTIRDALRILRNKRSIAGGVLTVTAEDDATPAWTATVTTAAGNPVTNIDPA
jgi:hypothetical protein